MKEPGIQSRMETSPTSPEFAAFLEPNNLEESSSGLRAALYQKSPFVVRFGSAIVFVLLAAFAIAASTIRFANPVRVPVRIVAGAPLVNVNLPPGTHVLRMLVKDGDKVTVGQPLATLSAPDMSSVFTLPLTGGSLPAGLNLPLTNAGTIPIPAVQAGVRTEGFDSTLRAPAEGVISYVAPPEQMSWRPGIQGPLVIVPRVHAAPRAYASIPPDIRGRLNVPASIRIEVPGYPRASNGWLEAKVTRVSAVSQDNFYMATIELNGDLRTTRGVAVVVEGQMLAQGELDTGSRRLIDILWTGLMNRVSPGR